MWPPRSAASVSRSATAAPGSSSTVISLMRGAAYSEQLARCRKRRLVRRVAQQRLPHALAEDARLAARGAQHGPLVLLAIAVAAHRLEPARAAVERHRAARRHLDRDAREPRCARLLDLVEAQRDLAAAAAHVRLAPPAAALGERGGAPAQARAQPPPKKQRGGPRAGAGGHGGPGGLPRAP